MAVSIVQTGCTVLTQSFAVLFQLPSPYLSSALLAPSFSPTNREIKLRKPRKTKNSNLQFLGKSFSTCFHPELGWKDEISLLPFPMGKKVVKTLCSEWMKHFVVNHFGNNFSVELDCAQGRWSHSWGSCSVKPELSIYSGQMSKSLWARSLGCFFNSFIETYTMSYFLPWGQELISCKGGELLRGVRPWRKGKNVKVNQSCKLDPDLRSPAHPF